MPNHLNNNRNTVHANTDGVNNYSVIENGYNEILRDKQKIRKITNQYTTLNSAYENGNIMVTSNYYNFVLLLIIVVLLLLFLVKVSIPLSQVGGKRLMDHSFLVRTLFLIILLFIIYNLFSK